jgi:hypothetical protein
VACVLTMSRSQKRIEAPHVTSQRPEAPTCPMQTIKQHTS